MWIDFSLPPFEGDVELPGEIEYRVQPVYDAAFADCAADEVQVYGADEKWHTIPSPRDQQILNRLKAHDQSAWCEIEAARMASANNNTYPIEWGGRHAAA